MGVSHPLLSTDHGVSAETRIQGRPNNMAPKN
jgi:hypothetical protein